MSPSLWLAWSFAALGAGAPRSVLDEAVTSPEQRTVATFPGAFDAAPVPHWSRRIPGGVSSSAAAAESARLVIDGGQVLIGSSTASSLFALDRRDGSLLRTFAAAAPVQAGATIVDDLILFSDTGGHTWCYRRDGSLLWSHDAGAPILASPVADGDQVFVTTVDDLVVALSLTDGALVWRYQHRADLARRSELALYAAPSVVIHDDEVLTGFSDGAMLALTREGGDVRWQVRVGEGKYPDIVAEPLVGAGLLYVSAYFDPLVALDLDTKRSRWVVEVGSAAPASLDVGPLGPVLYHPGTDGKLRALDPATGDERWAWASGADGALTHPVPVEAGVFVGSTTGTLWLVDGTTGETLWTYAPPFVMEGLSGAPAIDGRQIIFATHAGRLHSLVAPRSSAAVPGAHYELERRLEVWTPPARASKPSKRTSAAPDPQPEPAAPSEPPAAPPQAAPSEPQAAPPQAAPSEPPAAPPAPQAAPSEPQAAPPEPQAAPPEPQAAPPGAQSGVEGDAASTEPSPDADPPAEPAR
jgi:outer membrane protein assembly factor BamB